MSGLMVSLALWPFDILATPSSQPAITWHDNDYSSLPTTAILTHLSTAEIEWEWLSSVPGAVHFSAVGEGEDVVTDHLVARFGEAGSIPRLQSLDINTHC